MRLDGNRGILPWTLAWGFTGIALYASGVFNSPRTGPLWLALVGGAVPWALAGAFTFRSDARARLDPVHLLIWAVAYLLSFGLAAFAAGSMSAVLGGFFFTMLGWSIGAAAGAFASAWLIGEGSRFTRAALTAGIWLLGFFAGGYAGLIGLYLGPELAKLAIGSIIGQPAALTLGAGAGCALGGLAASAIAASLARPFER